MKLTKTEKCVELMFKAVFSFIALVALIPTNIARLFTGNPDLHLKTKFKTIDFCIGAFIAWTGTVGLELCYELHKDIINSDLSVFPYLIAFVGACFLTALALAIFTLVIWSMYKSMDSVKEKIWDMKI